MKTLGKTLALIIIVLGIGSTASFASNKVEAVKKESKLQVAFLPQHVDQMVVTFQTSGDMVELNLLDEDGQNIHSEAVSGDGVFTKRYNLAELDKGIYSFEVKNGNSNFTKTVVLK